jgi:hypothetical protein
MHSLIWLLAHPVAASMIVALLCLASTVSSWGCCANALGPVELRGMLLLSA